MLGSASCGWMKYIFGQKVHAVKRIMWTLVLVSGCRDRFIKFRITKAVFLEIY